MIKILFFLTLLSGCHTRFMKKNFNCSLRINFPGIGINRVQYLDQKGSKKTLQNITVMQTLSGKCR
jgi:hypothetical protein